MKERPILFSAPMVRALLAGTKTQTRRAVKPQPVYSDVAATFASWAFHRKGGGMWLWPNAREDVHAMCPYGQSGDRLWVRETFHAESKSTVHYRADGFEYGPAGGWKPSIFMPRWASRITLEVVGVRVERLQEISAADAWAEGVPHSPDVDPLHEYRAIWTAINGAGNWDANPWVWCVTFKRVTQ